MGSGGGRGAELYEDGCAERSGRGLGGRQRLGGCFVACAPQTTGFRFHASGMKAGGVCYWQASQVPPLRMASMEQALFSASVNSFAGRRSWFALSMELLFKVLR